MWDPSKKGSSSLFPLQDRPAQQPVSIYLKIRGLSLLGLRLAVRTPLVRHLHAVLHASATKSIDRTASRSLDPVQPQRTAEQSSSTSVTPSMSVNPDNPALPALKFEILAKCSTTRARVSRMTLPHGVTYTPAFMPVGASASSEPMAHCAAE